MNFSRNTLMVTTLPREPKVVSAYITDLQNTFLQLKNCTLVIDAPEAKVTVRALLRDAFGFDAKLTKEDLHKSNTSNVYVLYRGHGPQSIVYEKCCGEGHSFERVLSVPPGCFICPALVDALVAIEDVRGDFGIVSIPVFAASRMHYINGFNRDIEAARKLGAVSDIKKSYQTHIKKIHEIEYPADVYSLSYFKIDGNSGVLEDIKRRFASSRLPSVPYFVNAMLLQDSIDYNPLMLSPYFLSGIETIKVLEG